MRHYIYAILIIGSVFFIINPVKADNTFYIGCVNIKPLGAINTITNLTCYDNFQNGVATWYLNGCAWDTDKPRYLVMGQGYIGNNGVIITAHLAGNECNDGTCEWLETETWDTLNPDKPVFLITFDAEDYNEMADFIQGYTKTAPNNKWDARYFWYNPSGCTFTTKELEQAPYGGGSEETNIFSQMINDYLDKIINTAPFSYVADIHDAFYEGFNNPSTSDTNLTFDLGQFGSGTIDAKELWTKKPEIANTLENLLKIACYAGGIVGFFYLLIDFFNDL